MYFIALATDYDGTIAEDGVVADATLEALRELKQSGRKLFLVTGRQLPDLRNVLPEIALFDLIVAENGGLPSSRIQCRWVMPSMSRVLRKQSSCSGT
jgi:HAD superfamily hydrolase (TIGR01484 family)